MKLKPSERIIAIVLIAITIFISAMSISQNNEKMEALEETIETLTAEKCQQLYQEAAHESAIEYYRHH